MNIVDISFYWGPTNRSKETYNPVGHTGTCFSLLSGNVNRRRDGKNEKLT